MMNKICIQKATISILIIWLLCLCYFQAQAQNKKNILITKEFDGIDVSHHQGKIDWQKVARDTFIQFVYIKATEGSTYVDSQYQFNLSGARKAKMKVGVYHYFRTTSSVKKQFEHFKKNCPKDSLDLIPMVDVENCGKWSRSKVQKEVKRFCKLIEKHYGVKPMIYSVRNTYNKYLAPELNKYPLYIGRYGDEEPSIIGKGHYTIWQYSEKGVIKGIPLQVDLCQFHPACSIDDILMK